MLTRPIVYAGDVPAASTIGATDYLLASVGGDLARVPPALAASMVGQYTPFQYGAVGDGVTDDTAAFQAMFAAVPSGGVCYIPPASSSYLIDGGVTPGDRASMSVFHIDKPMTILGGLGSGKILVKGDGGSFKAAGERGWLFWIDSDDVLIDGLHIDCNTENIYGEELDGTKYYASNQAATETIGVEAIKLYRDDGDVHTSNVVVQNCRIVRSSFGGINFSGRKLDLVSTVFDDIFDEAGTISNCHIRNNYVEGGQRSTIVFTGGARHCSMTNNFIYNPHWAGLRFYLMCYDCEMRDNWVVYNGDDIEPTHVQTDDNTLDWPGSVVPLPRLGRFGHESRLPGTVRYCRAINNHFVSLNTAALDASLTSPAVPVGRIAFQLESDTVGNEVCNNVMRGDMKTLVDLGTATSLVFNDNTIEDENADGSTFEVAISFTGNQTGGQFCRNTIRGGDRGITTLASQTMDECQFDGNTITGCPSPVRLSGAVTKSSLSYNTIHDGGNSIYLEGGGSDVTIKANKIHDDTSFPILLDGVSDTSITGNDLTDYALRGIDLRNNCSSCFVTGNKLRSSGATGGIRIAAATSTAVALTNNDLRGSGTTEISDSGTSTVNTGNLT